MLVKLIVKPIFEQVSPKFRKKAGSRSAPRVLKGPKSAGFYRVNCKTLSKSEAILGESAKIPNLGVIARTRGKY